MTKEEFLNAIRGNDVDKRFAAWRSAGEMDESVVPELVSLSGNTDPGVAKAAGEALTTLVHSVGKDFASPKRAALAKALNARHTVLTLRLLSLIGGDAEVPAVAKSLANPALAEEAIFALERIPGGVAERAMMTAYSEVAAGFRPRLIYALGRRKMKAAEPLARRAMMDRTALGLAQAGSFAKGRIGLVPNVNLPPTRPQDLVHYAEAALADGNQAVAQETYTRLLQREEEHLQCAGLVGLGRIGTQSAAQAVFPLLKSKNRKVAITARNVWKKFAEA